MNDVTFKLGERPLSKECMKIAQQTRTKMWVEHFGHALPM